MGVLQPMSRLQVMCHWMAIFDIIFYFGTIIASVAVETTVSDTRPMKFQFEEDGSVSVSFAQQNELMALWDYLSSRHYSSSTIYNAVYMSLVVIAVSYLIVEVWLCCVLIRGATERSLSHCKRWFWWRITLMLLTVLVAATDLIQMQYTLTLLLFIPINVYRMTLLILVTHLMGEYQDQRSINRKMKMVSI